MNNKVEAMMASLDAMYKVFVEHNSNPADTVAYYNTKYGFTTCQRHANCSNSQSQQRC